jgi:hypothetical protein
MLPAADSDHAPGERTEGGALLETLPDALVRKVLALLPADARALAACVCRGWGAVLAEVSLWTRLNLSPSSGVTSEVTDVVLAGAAAKARGQLAALDVSGCHDVSFDALFGVVHANGGALRDLRVGARAFTEQTLDAERMEILVLAAPQLVACYADVLSHLVAVADARRMLRNEPPFQPLRLRALRISFQGDVDEATAVALAADLAAHASLQRVELAHAPIITLAALDAVVDAALARQMSSLRFWYCRLFPASALALVRLLGGGTLAELYVSTSGAQLLDAPSVALLGDALRANTTLTKLSFVNVDLWRNPDAAATLLSALTGHSSVCRLDLCRNDVDTAHNTVAGAALGALIAANAPALEYLDVSDCQLGDAGLRPLLDALPTNTHLRKLDVSWNDMSAACARDVLLPAVRANTSLRKLGAAFHHGRNRAVDAAVALVAARATVDAAAD